MALIRLAGHHIDNPQHIDKLIAIKGLPEEWIFRKSKHGGKELIAPWEPDIEDNIPKSIRHLCEEIEITVVFPPIEKGRESVVDKKKILGLKLDYSSGPGQEMWEKIERYLDRITPRDQQVPKPVLCAPNHKSDFSPHEQKRTTRGSMELRPSEVPMIDLTIGINTVKETLVPEMEKQVSVQAKDQPEEKTVYSCKKCDQKFTELNLLKGHNLRGHKKEAVKIGA